MLKFICPLIAVEDIHRSRHFYEQLLGQKVKFDFGQDVQFEGDFTIHLKTHFQSLLGDVTQVSATRKAHWGELYFESEGLEVIYQRLKEAGVEFIHSIHEQPWGQRAMRLYDPDGHVIEIGESMEEVVWRFHTQGLTFEVIREKSTMPREFIEGVIKERSLGQASNG